MFSLRGIQRAASTSRQVTNTHTQTQRTRSYLFKKSKFYYFDRAHVIFRCRFSSTPPCLYIWVEKKHSQQNTFAEKNEEKKKKKINSVLILFKIRVTQQSTKEREEEEKKQFLFRFFSFRFVAEKGNYINTVGKSIVQDE